MLESRVSRSPHCAVYQPFGLSIWGRMGPCVDWLLHCRPRSRLLQGPTCYRLCSNLQSVQDSIHRSIHRDGFPTGVLHLPCGLNVLGLTHRNSICRQ